jgi:hypothetical protein
MHRIFSPRTLSTLVILALVSCSGGGGGGDSEPTAVPNDVPILQLPTELTGGPATFSYTLPMTASTTLSFVATDINGDTLSWFLSAPAAGILNAGLNYASPSIGSTFTIALSPVAAPASVNVSILVEGAAGAAAAVDILLVRSGAPTVTGISRSSAFASAPQPVTISGSAFSLGNSVTTLASFSGITATETVVVDESTLTCVTPSPGILGVNSVGVSNLFGADVAPPGSFTMYQYPLDLLPSDEVLDAGSGSDLAVAGVGTSLQTVWIEGGMIQHRQSQDGGATWSPPQVLSGAEVPSEPQVACLGSDVVAVWIGDNQSVVARKSDDFGLTFSPAVKLNSLVGTPPVSRPRLSLSDSRFYCAWLEGAALGSSQRVTVSSSSNGGANWLVARAVSDQGVNQFEHAIASDGINAWIVYLDAPAASGSGVYSSRTIDGGLGWSFGIRRSAVSSNVASIQTCNDGARAYIAWVRDGQLEYMTSETSGFSWPTQATLLRGSDLGAISLPVLACEGERLFAAYVAGATTAAVSRVGALGAVAEHVTVSDVVENIGQPELAVAGNYIYVAYRSGDVGSGTGSARVRYATSVDLGLTFTVPSGLGDGTAAQNQPRLLVDEARVWVGWRDYRGDAPALFANRTEQ